MKSTNVLQAARGRCNAIRWRDSERRLLPARHINCSNWGSFDTPSPWSVGTRITRGDSMNTNDILLWGGFAIALLLCLPFAGTRKLVLEVTAWAVRLTLLALLAGGAFLWFRPAVLPGVVVQTVDAIPDELAILPSTDARTFGLANAC